VTMSVVSLVRSLSAIDPSKTWLVVGKGPSCDYISRVDERDYHVLTLNHACRVIKPTVAHFVDIESFLACGDALAQNLTYTCLPWRPHVGHHPGKTLLEHCGLFGEEGRSSALAWLHAKQKLVSYNATTASAQKPAPALPIIRLRHFGAVAAFNILAMAGVQTVHSIGIDGGTGYAAAFDMRDHLANGRKSFDAQTAEIRHTVRVHKIAWTQLGRDV
jgi:hypothetical protein